MSWWKLWGKRIPKQNVSIVCLVGESGSGKTTLADAMKRHGYVSIPSYTTRPPRGNSDASHEFVTPEEFAVLRSEMVAYQKFDQFEYGATLDQIKQYHLFVVDPRGLAQLKESLPDGSVFSIYLQTSPAERLRRMVKTRGSDDALRRLDHDTNYFHGFRSYDMLLNNETEDDQARNERVICAILSSFFNNPTS